MIDFQFLEQRLDHDNTVINELFEVFLTEFQLILAELGTSTAPERQAHRLKGMSQELGATRLVQLSQQLETEGYTADCLPQLKAIYPIVEAEIRHWQSA